MLCDVKSRKQCDITFHSMLEEYLLSVCYVHLHVRHIHVYENSLLDMGYESTSDHFPLEIGIHLTA